MWKAVSTISGLLGAMVAKRLLRAGYRGEHRKDNDPDSVFDPNDARFSWSEAVLWAAAGGIGLVIARIVSARVVAIGWEVATGKPPPIEPND